MSVDEEDDVGDMSGYIPLSYTGKGTAASSSRPVSPSARPRSMDRKSASSPSFSDIWSVDESLYLDDESASRASSARRDEKAKSPVPRNSISPVHPEDEKSRSYLQRRTPSSDHPDDESFYRIPIQRFKAVEPVAVAQPPNTVISPTPPPPPMPQAPTPKMMNSSGVSNVVTSLSNQKKISPTIANSQSSNGNRKMPLHSEDMSYGTSRGAAFMAGTSSKPIKAGLFTRREQEQLASLSLADRSDGETTVTSADFVPIPEATEPRAMYVPSTAPLDNDTTAIKSNRMSSPKPSRGDGVGGGAPRSGRNQRESVSRRNSSKPTRSQKREPPKETKQKPTPPKPTSAWDSFLVELTKVEEQFFSPFASTPAPQPEPSKRQRNKGSSNHRRRQQESSSSDSDEREESTSDSDSIAGNAHQQIRRFT